MKFSKEEIRRSMLLYAVTDRMWLKDGEDICDVVEASVKNGATFMQIREKELDYEAFLSEAVRMKEICNRYRIPFVVNDNIEIAIECKADGVHVGQSDIENINVREIIGDDMILGISVGNVEEAISAQEAGADYVGVGAMFATGTKKDARSVTNDMLKEITEAIDIPVVAIGGIGLSNLEELKGTGIDGIAVVSAIFAADNPGEATAQLLKKAGEAFVEDGALGKALENVRLVKPLMHNITNNVTVNDCANITLACGGSPVMSDNPYEVEDVTSISNGLNINIGTLTPDTTHAMVKAGRKSNELGHPVVLDPVGVGSSKVRNEAVFDLMKKVRFSVIRGNISEVKGLANGGGTTKGVDADVADTVTEENLCEAVSFAMDFAKESGAVLAITGAIDIVADSENAYVIYNGHSMMSRVTGTGCMLSAMTAAYAASNPDNLLEATAASVIAMGVAGELAYARLGEKDGNSSYRDYIIDAVYNLDKTTLTARSKYKKISRCNKACDLKGSNEKAGLCESTKMKTALAIAGSDCSGGAGIQADIKAMTMNGVYAMSAVTALTAQNTLGVSGIFEVSPEFLGEQLDSIFSDIRPDAVKIGMVSSSELIKVIAAKLKEYGAENIVVDPVMVATSGSSLLKNDAVETLSRELLPVSTLVTPNIPEAEILSGLKVSNEEEMKEAAKKISCDFGCAVLIKGGHSINDANDLLYKDGKFSWFMGKRIDNSNTHGTGCTLSSAIASNLAKGYELDEAVKKAKDYISGALSAMLDLGKGSGPMKHNFNLEGQYKE